MRILILTKDYPRPGYATRAAFNRQQFAALAGEHEARVIAPLHWTEVAADWWRLRSVDRSYVNADGIRVSHPTYYYTPRILTHRYGQFYWMSVRSVVKREIREFQPDVLLSCWAHPDGWAASRLAKEHNLPVVIEVIGSDVLVVGQNAQREPYIAEGLQRATRVAAVSHDLARHVERLGVDSDRIDVVSRGVDRAIFSPGEQAAARQRLGLADNERMILFVGSLLLSKGAAVLIEACRTLLNRGLRIRCHLVGNGCDEPRLRSLVARSGLDRQFAFQGTIPQTNLCDWYRASDLVALPSYSEGVPNVLREAMACGRPFVATRVGGIPEIAHPSFSRLVEPGKAEELADAIAELLAQPLTVDQELVRRSCPSWEESAERLAECLDRAVEAHSVTSASSVLDELVQTSTL